MTNVDHPIVVTADSPEGTLEVISEGPGLTRSAIEILQTKAKALKVLQSGRQLRLLIQEAPLRIPDLDFWYTILPQDLTRLFNKHITEAFLRERTMDPYKRTVLDGNLCYYAVEEEGSGEGGAD